MNNDEGILSGIDESDIPFEMELLKSPNDVNLWNNYIDHKHQQLLEATTGSNNDIELIRILKQSLLSLYYRQFVEFKGIEDWNKFIDYYKKTIKSFIEKSTSNEQIESEFNKILSLIESTDKYNIIRDVDYWSKFFILIVEFKMSISYKFLLSIFRKALNNLKREDHIKIWSIILYHIVKMENVTNELMFTLYFNYAKYLQNCYKFHINMEEIQENDRIPDLNKTFNRLLEYIKTVEQLDIFETFFKSLITPTYLLHCTDSELEIYKKYFDKIIDLAVSKYKSDGNFQKRVQKWFNDIVKKFKDQQSQFTIRYSKYLINIDQFDKSIEILESMMKQSKSIKDFTLLFDSLTGVLEEKLVSVTDEDEFKTNPKLVKFLDKFESLLSNRLLLLNDVKLAQNPNIPGVWFDRIEIMKERRANVNEILACYSDAIVKIIVNKVPYNERNELSKLWIDYAKVYYDNNDISNCRKILEIATNVPWTEIEQLEDIWINWVMIELEFSEKNTGKEDLKHATTVSKHSIEIPQQILQGRVDPDDKNLSVQMKIFKSVRLWSLYLDLIENNKDYKFEQVCDAYEQAISLKIVNGVMLINYSLYLEENEQYERCFGVYERGMKIFNGQSKTIIYEIYLNKILKFWQYLEWDKERVREIFENGIDYFNEEKDLKNLKKNYIIYSNWEMKYGSKMRCLKILQEAILDMNNQFDKLELYKILIINTIEFKGIQWVIDIFKDAMENISVQIPDYITEIVTGFVTIEVSLGNIRNARNILEYASDNIMEFNHNEEDRERIWSLFKAFELENGNETTYKEMLRRKIYLEKVFVASSPKMDNNSADKTPTRNTDKDSVGFVKSMKGPNFDKEEGEEEEEDTDTTPINEDAIDLDLDLEMDI